MHTTVRAVACLALKLLPACAPDSGGVSVEPDEVLAVEDEHEAAERAVRVGDRDLLAALLHRRLDAVDAQLAALAEAPAATRRGGEQHERVEILTRASLRTRRALAELGQTEPDEVVWRRRASELALRVAAIERSLVHLVEDDRPRTEG